MENNENTILKEEKERIEKLKTIARKKYLEENEKIDHKANTSFGKLILADEKTAPHFSFGTEKRFASDALTKAKKTPGPKYDVNDKMKFSKEPQWRIGNAKRPPLDTREKYDHYHHAYDENFDYGKHAKRWKKVVGCAMSTDPRIKYNFKEEAPGPGRYEVSLKCVKNKAPEYFFGEKTNQGSLNLLVGTNEIVGPGKYDVRKAAKHASNHPNTPHWTLQKDKRKGLHNLIFTKNETYYVYSAVKNQVDSKKRSEPIQSIAKATRAKSAKVGIFKQYMSKQPTKIRIEHPKF